MTKRILSLLLVVAAFAFIFSVSITPQKNENFKATNNDIIPIPTQVNERMENEEEFEEKKEAYLDILHGGDQYDWRAINKKTLLDKSSQKAIEKSSKAPESYANGALVGEWFERGSNDQAGNVRIATFDEQSEAIYAIGDGGILFKGDITGGPWQSLNDHYVLDRDVLESVRLPNGDLRLLAAIGNGVYYSDDEGQTWTESTGFIGSTWDGSAIDLIQLNDVDSTIVYLYTYQSVAQNKQNKLAYSKDHGLTFTPVHTFGSSSSSLASMCSPHNSSIAYILDTDDDVWVFEDNDVTQIADNMSLQGGSQCQIEVSTNATDTVLYILMDQNYLFRSDDAGYTFNQLPDLPVSAWEVGIGTSIDNVDAVYFGEMELYRSLNGGNSFDLVSNWYDYYNDVANKIHADIMNIQSFKTAGGTEFTLIPNHGGINISYDNLMTTPNIGMVELNVGQFYDIATSPVNSSLIMGGTQDQGLLRTIFGSGTSTVSMEQVISGDYGQQQYSNFGISFWTQYPGGDFSYYPDASFGGSLFWESIQGTDLPNAGWIIPSGAAPNPSDDYILVGGGNINGGNGSYLIKMENNFGSASLSQFPFNFLADAGAPITAIETTPINPDKWYVSTQNGHFYYSTDAGNSWTEANQTVGPGNDWIYSADIYASRINPDLVFLGGTNYQSSPVWMSVDGGQNFTALWNGDLPNTMVHELCMDANEDFLFAATDAGPYVYDRNQEEWFDLSGTSAPVQEYITCEYVEVDNLVRFATWGRGIWDFKMQDVTGIDESSEDLSLNSIYPNPSDGKITILSDDYYRTKVYALNGKEVASTALIPGQNKLNLEFLNSGTYVMVSMSSKGIVRKEKLIIR
ncbi:MAG: T9SS type A sorting domain-containing protein [Crocinitomicaceae bacterium]|nr:T9SS type A sorting domain-containing protein [Crocinitomicaceae bacterium]